MCVCVRSHLSRRIPTSWQMVWSTPPSCCSSKTPSACLPPTTRESSTCWVRAPLPCSSSYQWHLSVHASTVCGPWPPASITANSESINTEDFCSDGLWVANHRSHTVALLCTVDIKMAKVLLGVYWHSAFTFLVTIKVEVAGRKALGGGVLDRPLKWCPLALGREHTHDV